MNKLKPFGALFRETWSFYKNNLWTLVGIAAVPAFLGLTTSPALGFSHIPVLSILGFLLVIAASFLAPVAMLFSIIKGTDVTNSYKLAFTQIIPASWIYAFTTLIVIGGLVMGIIPGIIFGVWFMFSLVVFIAEGDKGLGALLKSKEYIRDYFWPTWGKSILFGIVVFMPFIILMAVVGGVIFGIVATGNGSPDNVAQLELIMDLVGRVAQAFVAPLMPIFLFMLYRNLTELKPSVAAGPVQSKRGFWIFAAVLGAVAPIILIILSFSFIVSTIPTS